MYVWRYHSGQSSSRLTLEISESDLKTDSTLSIIEITSGEMSNIQQRLKR